MAVTVDRPLMEDVEAVLVALAEFILGFRYTVYIREDAEVCTTLYHNLVNLRLE